MNFDMNVVSLILVTVLLLKLLNASPESFLLCRLYAPDQELACFSEPLFDKTNNEAEYLALIKGIKVVCKLKFINVKIYADSELVVKQVLGIYKVKNERMKNLHAQVLSELQKTNEWSISHVRREKNTRADELSKIGLEKARSEK